MNATTISQTLSPSTPNAVPRAAAANDTQRDPREARDAIGRAFTRLRTPLRAAVAQYARPADVDDVIADAFLVAVQRPGAFPASERAQLSWLIGVAKRCAPAYVAHGEHVPFDDVLALDDGDDV